MKTLGIDNNFLAIDEAYSNLQDSKIVILPLPYEHSVSYGKGTSAGPAEILKASAFVEFYDDEFENELCFNEKIATVEPVDFDGKVDREALDLIRSKVTGLLDMGKFVVSVGGEHTISIGAIEAHFSKYPYMSILHFDAHSDLRTDYENSPYSHACFMARVTDFFPNERITQVGIRAQCKEEAGFIKEKKIKTFYSSAIRRGIYGKNWVESVVNTLGDNVYISFDLDSFDPSVMPSTGTPEPDGFLYNEALEIFRALHSKGKKIIGFDVVELAPIEHLHHPNLTAARLIYKILNFAFPPEKITFNIDETNLQEKVEHYKQSGFSSDDELKEFSGIFLGMLNKGKIRSAEPGLIGKWNINVWVKEGILILFKHGILADMSIGGDFRYFDKHTIPLRHFEISDNIRLVPGGSSVRSGAYLAPGVICMPPMYINIGSYVDSGSMIDSHALVGTCAQIGKKVHLSAASQIGGVLEPSNARPVIIEDEVYIGGNCGIYEGVLIRKRAVLASGVILTGSSKVFDLVNEKIIKSENGNPLEIPENAVLVPGSRAVDSDFGRRLGLSLSSALIVKYRDGKTDAKTLLNEILR